MQEAGSDTIVVFFFHQPYILTANPEIVKVRNLPLICRVKIVAFNLCSPLVQIDNYHECQEQQAKELLSAYGMVVWRKVVKCTHNLEVQLLCNHLILSFYYPTCMRSKG